jgi:hypothetical protein
MARRLNLSHDEETRRKIQTTQLINRLMGHVNGEVPMENSQVKAAQILLAKALPDLSTVTMKGDADNPLIPSTIEIVLKNATRNT